MRRVVELVERHDGLGTTRALAAERLERALVALRSLPAGAARDGLRALVDQLRGAPS